MQVRELQADDPSLAARVRDLGFAPEALLCDQLLDPSGELHDLMVLAHHVEDNHSAMLTAGLR